MRPAAVVLAIFALSLLLISGCRDTATGTFGNDEDVMPSDASGGSDVTMASDLGDTDAPADSASGWTCQLDSRVRPFCRSVGFGPGHPYWNKYVAPLPGFQKEFPPSTIYDWNDYEHGPGSACDEFWDDEPFEPGAEVLVGFERINGDLFGNCCEKTTFIGGHGYTCVGPKSTQAPLGAYASIAGTGYVCCGPSKTVAPELCSDGPKALYVHYYRFPPGAVTIGTPEGVRQVADEMFQDLGLPSPFPSTPTDAADPICDHWGYGTDIRPIKVVE